MAEVEVDEGLAARIDAATVRARAGAVADARPAERGHDGVNGRGRQNGRTAPPRPDPSRAILATADWLRRDISRPEPLLGTWLTTTSRVMLYAPTGLGKTMLGLGLGMAIAAGAAFLKWDGCRPRRVLYVDGEMSSRLLKERLAGEVERLRATLGKTGDWVPGNFYVLSHEDIENFAPLDTPEGREAIEEVIRRIGGVDLIIFDNIMSLISGDMKDEEGWARTLPWIKSLTKRKVGEVWVHHTGHDGTHSYGTKTREWQLDTVIHADTVKREDTDVSMKLVFEKARERRPDNRAEFAEVVVALVDDEWTWSDAAPPPKENNKPRRGPKTAPIALDALREAIDAVGKPPASSHIPNSVRKVVTADEWRSYSKLKGISAGGDRAHQLAFKACWEHLVATKQVGAWNGQVWPCE